VRRHVRLALALSDETYIQDNSERQDPYQLIATLQNGKLRMNNPIPD
jgi:hypothetical protein